MFFQPDYLLVVIGLAVLPSLVWLFFYLKEDTHPEPRRWLFTAFLMGVTLAPIVIFLEMMLTKLLGSDSAFRGLEKDLLVLLVAPLVEEASKYGIIHLALNRNPVLDEPVDGMIYVIVAALGFAAIENVFAIFSFVPPGLPGYFGAALNFVSLRFISAVALHGLASGIVGYFFAKFYFIKRDPLLIVKGLILAVVIHGTYNFLIIRDESSLSLVLTGLLLGGTAALVLYLFNRLKHHETYKQAEIDTLAEQKV